MFWSVKIIIKRDFLCDHFQPIPQEDHYGLKKLIERIGIPQKKKKCVYMK